MKKIGLLLPDFEVGGMPVVASMLIRYLKNYYDVTLILINSDAKIVHSTYGVRILRGPVRGKSMFGKAVVFLKRYVWLKKLFSKEKFNVVISFGVMANFFNAKLENKKAILTQHSVQSIENKQWGVAGIIYDKIMPKTYPSAYKTVCVSHGVEYDLRTNYNIKNTMTIYNPMDTDVLYNEGVKELNETVKPFFDNGPVILSVGRITKPKQPEVLVRVFKRVIKEIPSAKLLLAGVGDQLEVISQKIIEEGLQDNAFLIGRRDDIPALMKNAYLTVLVSKNEGLPNVLIESLIQKTPVIATDILAGPREIISAWKKQNYEKPVERPIKLRNGILIPPIFSGNRDLSVSEKILAEVLIKSLKDNNFSNSFSYDVTGVVGTEKKYDELIKRVLSFNNEKQ